MTPTLALMTCATITCTSPDSAATTFHRGPGTDHVFVKTTATRAGEAYSPQAEEYCRKRNERGEWVKDGHYILWGPNGERLEEGGYVNGSREGAWSGWSPGQIQKRRLEHGKLEGTDVIGTPREFPIDFCACNCQWMGVYWGLGSDYWKVLGRTSTECFLEVGGEIEMGALPRVVYPVPRSLGRVVFHASEHGRIDLSLLQPFAQPDSAGGSGPSQSCSYH